MLFTKAYMLMMHWAEEMLRARNETLFIIYSVFQTKELQQCTNNLEIGILWRLSSYYALLSAHRINCRQNYDINNLVASAIARAAMEECNNRMDMITDSKLY